MQSDIESPSQPGQSGDYPVTRVAMNFGCILPGKKTFAGVPVSSTEATHQTGTWTASLVLLVQFNDRHTLMPKSTFQFRAFQFERSLSRNHGFRMSLVVLVIKAGGKQCLHRSFRCRGESGEGNSSGDVLRQVAIHAKKRQLVARVVARCYHVKVRNVRHG